MREDSVAHLCRRYFHKGTNGTHGLGVRDTWAIKAESKKQSQGTTGGNSIHRKYAEWTIHGRDGADGAGAGVGVQ